MYKITNVLLTLSISPPLLCETEKRGRGRQWVREKRRKSKYMHTLQSNDNAKEAIQRERERERERERDPHTHIPLSFSALCTSVSISRGPCRAARMDKHDASPKLH
jgi:hypothetical protein